MEKFLSPLSKVEPDKEVSVVSIQGGKALKARLVAMGLNEGVKLKVLQSQANGPCLILVGETRLMLGYGMAQKILVKEEEKISKKLTIALAGNPNSGKTTIFNNLTGAHQHVGNYPGVTVEKKEGYLKYKDYKISVVDLPGTYSLTAYSIDEIVARNFLIEEKPDVVIDIIDSSNLERALYLTTQFIELEIPLVLAFNMYDLAERGGFLIDKDRLSKLLGCPIIFTVATKNKGMDELLDAAIRLFEDKAKGKTIINYGSEIEEELAKLEGILIKDKNLTQKYPQRWLGVKLLEEDIEVIKKVRESEYSGEILRQVEKSIIHLKNIFGDTAFAIIADKRYGFISGACSESIQRTYETRHAISDRIDKVLINRILGLPIFLGIMWLVFKFAFGVSNPLITLIEKGQGWLGVLFGNILPEGIIQSLVVDGIIGGVGSVLAFIPLIFLLFLAMAVLEDSGYMARASFIMDGLMHKIGLHGRSFIPMILGFGCNLPAIMATRTIADRKDRLTTILIIPFMSCSARLPVYTLFIGAFFEERIAPHLLFSLYLLGILVAIIMAFVFRKFLFKGETAPFVMELPPYRLPAIKGLLIHMWEIGGVYLKKAGTIIFLGCILAWFLSNFPRNEGLERSYAGKIGRLITPIFKPLGFDDWRVSTALLEGFIAKELIIGVLGTLHSIGKGDTESLRQALFNQANPSGDKFYNPLVAYSLVVFILLYIPCLATLAVIKKETNSWTWPAFACLYTSIIAWIASFIIYQGGKLLGL